MTAKGLFAFLLEDEDQLWPPDTVGEDTPLRLDNVLTLRRERGTERTDTPTPGYISLNGSGGRGRMMGLDGQPYAVMLEGGFVSVVSDEPGTPAAGWFLDCGMCLIFCAIPVPSAIRRCLGSRYLEVR